jgi:hypothetical protein
MFKLIVKCERGWSTYYNKCIKLFEELKTFNEAKNICELNDATLISIHSKEENDFVCNLINNQSNLVWIGCKRNSYNNTFEWINGKAFNYTNFFWSKPSGGDYVVMSKFEGVWRIVPNTQSTQPFLCEYMKSSF